MLSDAIASLLTAAGRYLNTYALFYPDPETLLPGSCYFDLVALHEDFC
jgi:hypothetical protein